MISLYCLADHALHFFKDQQLYRTIYIVSDIWQEVGWGSIIYLAALAGIDQQLYEAAEIDGAGKWQQTLHVTIPGITPTIITMFILRVGNLMSMGYEKTILLTAVLHMKLQISFPLYLPSWSSGAKLELFNGNRFVKLYHQLYSFGDYK